MTSAYAKLAQLNPFRYRGYVWDEETGLYSLRSRYYDPAWGRDAYRVLTPSGEEIRLIDTDGWLSEAINSIEMGG